MNTCNTTIPTDVQMLTYVALNIGSFGILCMIISFIILTFMFCIIDDNHYHLHKQIGSNESIIYITDLSHPMNIIDGLMVKYLSLGFNKCSQRPIYVYDITDINGIINVFRATQKARKNLIIFIDSLNDDPVITATIQNAMLTFQYEKIQKISCCVVGIVKSASTIIALTSDILYMDNYARLSDCYKKNGNILLKKTLSYLKAPILKKGFLLNLFCEKQSKEIGRIELNKQVPVYQMMAHHHLLIDILKELKYYFRKSQ